MARVLFVSKPIVPPWHDGSKNLVRDVAQHLVIAEPTVMVTPEAPPLGPRVTLDPVYRDPGRFAPSLMSNARVMRRLMFGDGHDIWHFVFAPNAASSTAAIGAIAARRAAGWKGKVVQTVASAPRTFEGVNRWIFGDHVVALSDWTRGSLLGAGVHRVPITVIPPCAAQPRILSEEEKRAVRRRYDLGDGPVALYPGDYEVSRGARTVARAVPALVRAVPDVRVVFACRPKTPRAAEARREVEDALLEARHDGYVRHLGEVDDMHGLLAAASVVLFPVDDLYGKVDLPLVLLEAMALGIPMVVARGGPLESLQAARFVDPGDAAALAREAATFLTSPGAAAAAAAEGTSAYKARFTPRAVAALHDELYERVLGRRQ